MRQWLVDVRKECGLSQKIVSERIGVAQPSYCNIENGKTNPAIGTAKKIADVLGFEWTRFFADDAPGPEGRDRSA